MQCGKHHKKIDHHGCCCEPSFHRHFLSDDEKIQQLEHYLDSLKCEIDGVEKAIKQLRKE